MGHPPLATAANPIQLPKQPKSGGCAASFGCFGCVGLFALFFLSICTVTTLIVEGSRPIPGDAGRFDPVAALPAIAAMVGEDAVLTGLQAQYVRSDGTLDLWAGYGPWVRYEFHHPVAAANDRPIGAGGSLGDTVYEPVTVNVSRPFDLRTVRQRGGGVSVTYQYINLGVDPEPRSAVGRPPGAALAAPTCSFADLWQKALAQDAPPAAVALISYDSGGYTFAIQDIGLFLRFDERCQRLN